MAPGDAGCPIHDSLIVMSGVRIISPHKSNLNRTA
jgi:hypothetical protein